ncbi:PASTA domain-containing protein [Asanoa siamensis]|uniref:PASTA domain-containing protein n=1 Tax=Asanoa siamensis TaxID=926357 RepID=A0ABQ4D2W5_9ACTN|nr:PASTA domain-containing protein [Asanoa siamensis]GIF77467.1 hypothetical protein Asi02nite_69850 [Asanoa siamensis]
MADQPEDPRTRRGASSDDSDQPLDQTAPFDPIRDDEDEDAATPRTSGDDQAAASTQPLDHTAPFDPIRDDDDDDDGAGAGDETDSERTQAVPSRGDVDAAAATQALPDDPERTARVAPPDDDRTTQISAADRRLPPDDRTTRIQQQGLRNATPAGDGAWEGRAGIPQPGGPGEPPDDGPPGGWQPGPPDDGRRWWMPILIGLIALVLLGVLAFGLWLILRGDDGPAPEPSPTTPVATTAAPTSAAPTSSSPSPTPTTAAQVVVPILEGLTVDEARQRLSSAGLSARLNYVDSDRPAGTVVGSDPGPGERVDSGSTVTVDISLGPAPTPTPSPTATPSPTSSPSIPPGP